MSQAFTLLNNTRSFTQLSLASVFINLLSLALPFTMLQIYDRILPNQSYGTATVLAIGVTIAIFLEMILRYARSWVLAASAANFELRTTTKVVNSLLTADYQPIERMGTGRLFKGLSSISEMRELYSGQAAIALLDFPFVLIFLALVAYIGGYLVLIPIAVWAIVIGFVFIIGKKLSLATEQLSLSDSQRSALLIQVLSGLTSVKALALETKLSSEYRQTNYQRLAQQQQVDWLSAKLQELIQGASQATTLVLVLLGCLSVLNGDLTTGGLAACSILAGRAVAPLSAIISLKSRIALSKTAMDKVDELVKVPQESFKGVKKYQQKIPLADIHFQQVSYEKHGVKLKDLSLSLPAGKLITLTSNPLTHASATLSLLGNFSQPDNGEIIIGDTKLLEHSSEEFRQSVLFVPPWPTLFNGTLMDNMTMFQPQLESEAMEIADKLGLTTTIAHLPSGYATRISEDNNQILGKGAIKIIAFVRAIVQKPSILLLEEPMISLDVDAQQRLIALLTSLKGKQTTLVVSHYKEIARVSDEVINIGAATNEETSNKEEAH